MRKVKFTQEAFDERLSQILSEFPILDVSVSLHLYCNNNQNKE